MPTAGGLGKAVRRGAEIGCTAVQVFTSSPQQWKAKEVTDEMVADFRTAVTETAMGPVVSHDSYLINLCAPDPEMRAKSEAGLLGELRRCAQYGIPFVVSHMGAHMGAGPEAGVRQIAEATLRILEAAPNGVTLLMETTAGQGSAMNARFEELAEIREACGGPANLGVCLDTCHVFAAGYDLRTEEAYAETFATFDRIVGIAHLKAIHVNDSKKPLGSRVDRHAGIGEGEIGRTAFAALVNDPRLADIPMLLETPEAETRHAENLAVLQGLRASAPDR